MRNYLNYIKLFSRKCYACNKQALSKSNHSIFCPECWTTIQNSWTSLEHPLDNISFINAEELQHHWIAFHFNQNGIAQKLLHHLKYKNGRKVAFEMGKILGRKINKINPETILLPVPLHPKKLRKRGYNQSELIAKGISEVTGLKIDHHKLKRQIHSSTQTHKNKEERQKSAAEAFSFEGGLNARHYILVDDLITTGSTLKGCIDAIQKEQPELLYSIACLGINDLN